MNVIWLIVVIGGLFLAQGLIFKRFAARKLTYERRFAKIAVFEGDSVDMIEVLSNKKPLPLPWVRVESRISKDLLFGKQVDLKITEDHLYHRSIFYMNPYTQVTRRHAVKCIKRGEYRVDTVAVTVGDLFGVSVAQERLTVGARLMVYPRLLSPKEIDLPSSRFQGDLTVKRWIMPDPFLISGIREYRAGDALRDVHWGATARTGRMQVKSREHTADPRLMMILNVQKTEHQWADLMEYEQEAVEQAIRVIASIGVYALERGVEVGFASNACVAGDLDNTIVLNPTRSQVQIEMLLGALARLVVRRVTPFEEFLMNLSYISGCDIVIFTAYRCERLNMAVSRLISNGNSVTLANVDFLEQRAG